MLIQPLPALDVLVSEVTQMRDRTAEGRQAQPGGDEQDLPEASSCSLLDVLGYALR